MSPLLSALPTVEAVLDRTKAFIEPADAYLRT
jgi:hypothetical protein